jgi:hypothetical protein
MEYRTERQFIEIMDSAENGQFKQAAEQAEQAGFFAVDLLKHFYNTNSIYNIDDLVYIAEMTQELRNI